MFQIIIALIAILCIVSIAYYYTYYNPVNVYYISAKNARHAIKHKHIRSVVDVRSASEYQEGHYPDAISFPLHLINEQTVLSKETGKHIYSPTLVYCRSGKRARKAARLLHAYGIKRVFFTDAPYWKIAGIKK